MTRAFLVVMDSVGIGGAPDADAYFSGGVPDTGADTLGHIAQACAEGQADTGRQGPLRVPTLARLGLFHAHAQAIGAPQPDRPAEGLWAAATETSAGKDTPSGHWELAGLPVPWDWHYFPETVPAFPTEITRAVCEIAGCDGILGDCHGSGTDMIDRFGAEHIRTGRPICYTSADSVFQIAAHEDAFGLDRLLDLCERVAPRLHALRVGRVIARPFVGKPGRFRRTSNRRDYAIAPPKPILTNWVQEAGQPVHAVGKIGDIFSMSGIDTLRKGDDAALMGHLSDLLDTAEDGSLVFANFVEFDSLFGHRRDVAGYARQLEWFDAELGRLLENLRDGDLMVITADHGNDPTWAGTDHTRERVPVLMAGRGAGGLGDMAFADVAASVATHLGVPGRGPGVSAL
ncbi:phosphopentomutase [Citreimonas sp.]|uniref:phosphopentomutase n=1 Tax=Citreimonas sp. TaxID=3036715 RepID=UPI0040596E9C